MNEARPTHQREEAEKKKQMLERPTEDLEVSLNLVRSLCKDSMTMTFDGLRCSYITFKLFNPLTFFLCRRMRKAITSREQLKDIIINLQMACSRISEYLC